jgi:hypothetical protein
LLPPKLVKRLTDLEKNSTVKTGERRIA